MSKYQNATRAYTHIRDQKACIPERIDCLVDAAEVLAQRGWFDHTRIEKYSRHEWFDMMREIIGEAASKYGIPGTTAALTMLARKDSWLCSWTSEIVQLRDAYECSTNDEY
jgi:nucleoside-diphosphate-sugar epimerase